MKLSEYCSRDATELAVLVKRGEVTAKELAKTALKTIAAVNGDLNAVIETFPEHLDSLCSEQHPDGALRGVPMLNKDRIRSEHEIRDGQRDAAWQCRHGGLRRGGAPQARRTQ